MLRALFSRGGADELEERAGWELFDDYGTPSWSGTPVGFENARQLLAVHGSTRFISEGIATLPIDVFRRTAAGETMPLPNPRWLSEPQRDVDTVTWLSMLLNSVLYDGNTYLWVTRARDGITVLEAVVLDPVQVAVVRNEATGAVEYTYKGKRLAVGGELMHIRGMTMPGEVKGLNPIEYARQSIGLGLGALQYGAEWFANEGNMPGVIELSKPASPQVLADTARMWQRKRREGGRGMPGVIPDGGQWKATSINHEQAEFLATRKWTAAEIAGQLFLVDPTELGIPLEGSSITYANLEARATRRVTVTYAPWIVRIERAITELLPRGQFAKFNVDALLRGDSKTRWENYKIAEGINTSAAARGDSPVLSVQEMRDFEDFGPAPEAPEPPEPPAPAVPPVEEAPPPEELDE